MPKKLGGGRAAGLILVVLGGCDGSRALPVNQAPLATLTGRTPVRVSETVSFDASGSKDLDPGGYIALYRFIFPDGSGEVASAAPIVTHVFARSGEFDVALVAIDERGGEGRATFRVTVTPSPPSPCASDGDCPPGDICVAGECVTRPCGPDHPCSPPLVCQMGACVPPPPPPGCRTDGDCPPPRVCDATGVCVCGKGLSDCGGGCVDTRSSSSHCGGCFRACAPGSSCVGGTCSGMPGCMRDADCPKDRRCAMGRCFCAPGLTECGGVCASTGSDPFNCGACGRACGPGEMCAGGTCTGAPKCVRDSDCPFGKACLNGLCGCKPGLADCFGLCTDTGFDPRNCGACGRTCSPFEKCNFGSCVGMPPMCVKDTDCFGGRSCIGGVCTCKPGLTDCFGVCTDTRFDQNNCGACGRACGPTSKCDFGTCLGMPMCRSDFECPGGQVCLSGKCVCPMGSTDCFGFCTDTRWDLKNCGGCGKTCPPSFTCSDGACKPSGKCGSDHDCPTLEVCQGGGCVCSMPFNVCGASCVDSQTDPRNCGLCGRTCAPGQYCDAGSCYAPPGCMTSRDCDIDRTCTGGQCVCTFGRTDCFGYLCADLYSDSTNCGACGNVCWDTFQCVAGKCFRNPRGTILEIYDLPVPGDPLLGLDAEGFDSFWGNLQSGYTIRFDLFGGVRTRVRNPDMTGKRYPHGVSWSGFRLFSGMYVPPVMMGIAGSDLIRYSSTGALEQDAPGRGGGTAFGPAGTLFVLTQPSHELVVMNHISFAVISTTKVTGLSPVDNVYDIAHDGANVWVAGMTTSKPPMPFLKIIDPTTGALTETVSPPDAILTAVAYDGTSIWAAGNYLYRLQP